MTVVKYIQSTGLIHRGAYFTMRSLLNLKGKIHNYNEQHAQSCGKRLVAGVLAFMSDVLVRLIVFRLSPNAIKAYLSTPLEGVYRHRPLEE